MQINYQWLTEFVVPESVGSDVEKMAQALTRVGLNVEEIRRVKEIPVLDVEVTTNRPDCLSHLGIAREVAAALGAPLKLPDLSPPPSEGRLDAPTAVSIESPRCRRYAARVMSGLTVRESPAWLQERLESLGQRPVNNIVDVTNYVMLALGQPMHAFDFDALEEKRIVVREARPGECLRTLDGVERRLDPSMLLICDARRPLALAGIMGGQSSEVGESTRTILLESACFDPTAVRSTVKKLGMRTEASFRFERGTDPQMPVPALHLACRLIRDLAGGECASEVIDEYPDPQAPHSLMLRKERIRTVVGVTIDPTFVEKSLRDLQFEVEPDSPGVWKVGVPSFRVDVEREDDLVEEVARHYGYDRIPSAYPPAGAIGQFLPTHEHDLVLRSVLNGLGFYEAFNYSFSNPVTEELFWGERPSMTILANPLTEEDTHLRTSLLPGLLSSLRRNFNHGSRDVRLFEMGKVFRPGSHTEAVCERWSLGLVASGGMYRSYWSQLEETFQFQHLKGVLEALLAELELEWRFEALAVAYLHPGVSAVVRSRERELGTAGAVHPRISQGLKFRQRVLVAELDLEALYGIPLRKPFFRGLARFPAVERDLSFVIDNRLEYAKILHAVKELKLQDLQDVQLIDLYQGSNLPSGKVSMTVRLTFANPERTLTQEEVSLHTEAVFALLRRTFSVEDRS